MAQCSQCGSHIPDGQSICSMCMGDINYGTDEYYQQWAEEQERRKSEKEDYERECDESVKSYWQPNSEDLPF